MICNVKNNIKGYAALSTGKINVGGLKQVLLDKNEILNALDDYSPLIAEEKNFQISAQEQLQLKQALMKIPELNDFGMIMMSGDNMISEVGNRFFDSVLLSNEEAMAYVKDLPGVRGENPNQMNRVLNNVLKTTINETPKAYFGKNKRGKLVVSKDLANDINRHNYTLYVSEIANLADVALEGDSNVPTDFKVEVSLLKSGPIIHHLSSRIRSLNARLLKAYDNNDPITAKETRAQIRSLEEERDEFKATSDAQRGLDYIKKTVIALEQTVAEKGSNLSPEDIQAFTTSLDLITNSASLDGINPTFTEATLKDEDLVSKVQEYANRAERLKQGLKAIELNILKDEVDKTVEFTNEKDFLEIGNLKTTVGRWMQKVMGLHNIQNSIIHYIDNLVNEAMVKASIAGTNINKPVEDSFRKIKTFAKEKFFQRNARGSMTGRMLDVFNSEWYMNSWNILNGADRKSKTIEFNPEVLFEGKTSERRKNLEGALKNLLGSFKYKLYREEAKQKWEDYKESYAALEKSLMVEEADPTARAEALARYEYKNSPMTRINKYDPKFASSTSDNFLVVIPRQIDAENKDTGFYDLTYKDMEADRDALEFYKEAIYAHRALAKQLGQPQESLKTPKLAFVGSTAKSLMADGDYVGAMKASATDFASDFNQSSVHREMPKDRITGKFHPKLEAELISVHQEINRRISRQLDNSAEFQKRKESMFESDQRYVSEEVNRVREEVAKQVEKEMSTDILQSIVLGNHSQATYAEKKGIEAKLNLAVNIFHENVNNGQDATVAMKEAKQMAEDSLNHFLNYEYYNFRDKSQETTLWTKDKTDKNGNPIEVTAEGVLTGARKTMTYTFMGWSPFTALNNMLVGGFSNSLVAVDSKYFDFKDLWTVGYTAVKKPNVRAFLDKMYITGDLSYEYQKQNIHAEKKLSDYAKDPMKIHASAEKVNQGAIAVAIMHKMKVKNSRTGKETTLLNALDNDGNLSNEYVTDEFPGYKGSDLLAKVVVTRIRPENQRASGDYKSPLEAEKNAFGKLFTAFSKFMPEMIADRFGSRRLDPRTGETMGKYRAATNYMFNLMKGTQSDDLTKARAKQALIEALTITALRVSFLATKGLLCDKPECREQHPAIIAALNVYGRASQDIFDTGTGIVALSKAQAPVALYSLAGNWARAFTNVTDLLTPSGGVYKTRTEDHARGDWKIWTTLPKITPGYYGTIGKWETISSKMHPTGLDRYMTNLD